MVFLDALLGLHAGMLVTDNYYIWVWAYIGRYAKMRVVNPTRLLSRARFIRLGLVFEFFGFIFGGSEGMFRF